jgi:tRNA(Ile)-lysidine synthase TilS/MesJ
MSLMYASRPHLGRIPCAQELLPAQPIFEPLVITVDHKLRQQSQNEAAFVCNNASKAGLPSVCLTLDWGEQELARSKVMEAARIKRYRAIAKTCLHQGVDCLMTAHHLGKLPVQLSGGTAVARAPLRLTFRLDTTCAGDQLETLLMRLQFGSGLCGLAAMRPLTSMSHLLNCHEPELQKLLVLRPFLDLTRQDLRLYSEENGIEWVEDPTNQDRAYIRTRMRDLLRGTNQRLLNAKGTTQARLLRKSFADDGTGFREQVARLLDLCCQWRETVECQAVELALSAASPADTLVYWIRKCLDHNAQPVEFPCPVVQLDISHLQQASTHARFAVVSAALQAVHDKNHAPNSRVR